MARHLQTLIDAGDDPPSAELDPDADAVAVLTVHKAKGLEFPVVFMTGLVAGRFPTNARRDPLDVPADLVDEFIPTGDPHLQEERRLFYVGMTRARDELILTPCRRLRRGPRPARVAVRARGAGPALGHRAVAGSGAHRNHPLDQLTAFEPRPGTPGAAAGPARSRSRSR